MANTDLTYAYAADITKSERDEAGNLIVFGSATNPSLDLDGDRCDPAWLKRAMPEWFEWGNMREMHGPVAAGIGLELTEAEGDDWQVKSKCVDANCAKKVEEGVYKGYSIGIKNGVRKIVDGQSWIVDGTIVEVSYVDRPCNPTAKIAIAKAATVGDLDVLQPVEAEPVELKATTINAERRRLGLPTFSFPEADEPWLPVADYAKGAVIGTTQVEKGREILKALFSGQKREDIVKGVLDQTDLDEHDDVDGAMEAVACIARLIMSEANDLADGQLHEIYDLDTLMSALHGLKYFIACEEGQMDARNDVEYMGLWADSDILKRHFTAQQRKELASQGKAMPGGRYPIENGQDLHNAIHALGRGKGSHKAIKSHIIKRAKALGLTSELPEGWMSNSKGNKSTEAEVVKADASKDTETVQDIVKAAVAEVTKASMERIEALEAELAKVKDTPIPGGPVLMADDGSAVTPGQDDAKRARIADIRKRAENMDPALREDYMALADKLESEL